MERGFYIEVDESFRVIYTIFMNTLNEIQLQIRNQFIWEAKEKGLSLQEIADLFQNSLSKSRIHQIILSINVKKNAKD